MLPTFRNQIGDPTTYLDGNICTLSSAAMGLDFRTAGTVSVWGGQLIPYCGRSALEIRDKGTNLHNAAQAWEHWGEDLDIRDGPWAEAVRELELGNALILQGDYGVFPLGVRCQTSFEANHAVYVHPQFSTDGRSLLVGDPLCPGFRWFRIDHLRAYAEKLALDQRGTRTRLFFAVSDRPLPDTGTGDDMPGLTITKLAPVSGVLTVRSDAKHAAVQVADREYIWLQGGTKKRAIATGTLVPPLDGNAGDRSTVYLVGDEAAVLLATDVTFTADASDYNAGVTAASQKALEARR